MEPQKPKPRKPKTRKAKREKPSEAGAKTSRYHQVSSHVEKWFGKNEIDPTELHSALPILEKHPVIAATETAGGPEDVEIDPGSDADRILFTLTSFVRGEYARAFFDTQWAESREKRRKLNALLRALSDASDIVRTLHVDRSKWLNDPASDPTTAEKATTDFRAAAERAWRDAALYAAIARASIEKERRGASHVERDFALAALETRLARLAEARELPARELDKIRRAIWRAARLPDWDMVPRLGEETKGEKAKRSTWYKQANWRMRGRNNCP